MNNRVWVGLALSLLLVANPAIAVLENEQPAHNAQYALKVHGRTIGEVNIRRYEQKDGERVTEIRNLNRLSRQGTPFDQLSLTRYVEGQKDGKPLRFDHSMSLGEQQAMAADGSLQAGELVLNVTANHQQATARTPVAHNFVFPDGERIDHMYKAHFNDQPGSAFSFQTLNLGGAPEVVNTHVVNEGAEKDPAILMLAAQNDMPALRQGPTILPQQSLPLKRFAVSNPKNADSTVYEWRTRQGKLVRAQSPGTDVEMVYAQRMMIPQDTFDLVNDAEVLTNVIAQPRKTSEAVYRLQPLTGRNVNWASVPDSTWQTKDDIGVPGLSSAIPNILILKVKQVEPPDVDIPLPIRIDDPRYTQRSQLLETTDELVERTAEDVVGVEKRAYFAARTLRNWVNQHIETKSLDMGMLSAKETLLAKEGDCTEHAVLLAALTRAVGIPSRVAVGLVYVPENSQTLGHFVYHMWTEVYIGNRDQGSWYPMDAAFDEVLPDATHIKLADSALTDMQDVARLSQRVAQFMGNIKIDVVKSLSPSGSVITVGPQPGVLSIDIPKLDLQSIDIATLSRNAIKRYMVDLPPKALSLESSEGLFTRGLELLGEGRYPEAEATFRKSASKLRRPVEFYRLGERLASIEMYSLSREVFDKAVQGDGRFEPLVQSWTGAFFPRTQLDAAAQGRMAKAVSVELNATEVEGDMASADIFKEILKQSPGYAPALLHLGKLAERNGYYDDAVENYQRAASSEPGMCEAHDYMGDSYLLAKKYPQAIKSYSDAIACFQPHSFVQTKLWMDALQAKKQQANGAALLAKGKSNATGWLLTGKALYAQERFGEAKTAINNALAGAPGSAEAQIYRFKLLYHDFEWTKMARLYPQLVGAARQNANGALMQGVYEMRTRHYSQAAATLKRAMSMAPEVPDSYITIAEVYDRSGDLNNRKAVYAGYSIANLRGGLARMKTPWNRYRINIELGRRLLDNLKIDQAAIAANDALSVNPISSKAWLLKGQVELYSNELDNAKSSLETALTLDPNDSAILKSLGDVALERGQETVAYDFYSRAYKANPMDEKAVNALRKIIADQNLAAKPPAPIWTLTPDERDYMIQMFVMDGDFAGQELVLWEEADRIVNRKSKDLSIQSIDSYTRFIQLLNQDYEVSLAYYEKVRMVKAPQRLRYMQDIIAKTAYAAVLGNNSNLNNFLSRIRTEKETKEVISAFVAMAAGTKALGEALSQNMVNLAGHITKAGLTEILLETNIDLENEARDQIEGHQKSVLTKLSPSKDEKEKGGSKKSGTEGNLPKAPPPPLPPDPRDKNGP